MIVQRFIKAVKTYYIFPNFASINSLDGLEKDEQKDILVNLVMIYNHINIIMISN